MDSQTGGRFYAFLFQDESANQPGDASLLRFEVVRVEWFHRAWKAMREAGVPVDDVQERISHADTEGAGTLFATLPEYTRRALYDVHRAYAARTVDPADPAPVGLLEALVPDWLLPRYRAREGEWFEIHLSPGERLPEPRNPEEEGEAILGMLGETEEGDEPPTLHRIDLLGPPGLETLAWVDPVLPAVHYPHEPLADDDGRWPQPLDSVWILPDEGMDFDGGMSVWRPLGPRPGGGGGERIFASRVFREAEKFAECPNAVCTCRRRAVDECIPQWRRRRWASAARTEGRGASASTPTVKQVSVSLAPGVSIQEEPGLKWHGGGVHGMQVVVAAPAPPPPAVPVAAPGGYQPFVGANRVGAGNNLALWDDHGRLSAYVDYGFPAPHNRNTYPAGTPDPCVCADPLVVLTHWDYDHYSMARRVPRALRLRWVAPEQKYGTAAIKYVYQPLLDNAGYGARLMLWRAPAGHVAAPFGVLVRADGTTLNESGIAAYVRADPGEGRAPPPASPQLARQEKPSALIVAGRLPGEWIDGAVLGPFSGEEVVVPAAVAGAFAAPGDLLAAGDRVELVEGVRGRWIPPEGFPCEDGGRYDSSGGQGGWALSAGDFVRAGGCILDFPDAGTGKLGARVYSPTPDAGREWTAGGGAGAQTVEGWGLEREDRSWWRPVWTEGPDMEPCRMEVPANDAETLAVSSGRPPLGYGSAWLLLPGDAGFQDIPPQREGARRSPAGVALTPRVVGLVATHHGADTWISPPPHDKPELACIPYATGRDDCQQIVYCYGTRAGKTNPGGHCYARKGVDGHPHARAIAAYQAHNWGTGNPRTPGIPFNRLNAAPEDYQSRQPFNPLNIPAQPLTAQVYALGHRSGNVALGWDSVVGGPLTSDHLPAGAAGAQPPAPGVLPPLRRTCPHCPDAVKERDYYF